MRPFELTVAAALAVGPAVGVPLHGGPFHGTQLHVLVDSLLGLVVGVALVAVYLLVLRRIDSSGDGDSENATETPSRSHRSRNS
jgi:NhaP-type Na+/H+ or K+/H+ antiporter